MIRVIIIAAALLLTMGAVGVTLIHGAPKDPGPAIILDQADVSQDRHDADDARDRDHDSDDQAKNGATTNASGDQKRVDVEDDGDDDDFTVAQPKPVRVDDDHDADDGAYDIEED